MSLIPPPYKYQDEKKEFFSLRIIDNDEELFNFMKILPKSFHEKAGIWRGLPESRYKLYNSLQRKNLFFKKLNSVEDVIRYIIDSSNKLTIWNKGLIPSYFSNNNIEHVSIYAKLSILQHFGSETPLLDWTRNPNVAMYFATQSLYKTTEEDLIDNYFSIYFINRNHPYFEFNTELGVELLISEKKTNEEINAYFNDDNYILKSIHDFPIQCVNDKGNKVVNHSTMSNYNITAQNGLFILNSDPYRPLEEAILNRIQKFSNEHHAVSILFENALLENQKHFICYDIHKKFIPKITSALNSKEINITKETMEPDFNRLKDDISFEKIIKILNK